MCNMTNSFIEIQKELARERLSANLIAFEEMTPDEEKSEKRPIAIHSNVDTLITQVIQNTHTQYREYADKYELEEVRQAVEALSKLT